MDNLDDLDFSNDQRWIIHLRCSEKIAFRDDHENPTITPAAIKTCLKRSALALMWSKGAVHGTVSYLSKPDIELLKNYIADQCEDGHPSNPYDILAEAQLLRKERQLKPLNSCVK